MICRSKTYMPIKELPADQRIVWSKINSICKLKNYLQIEKLSPFQRTMCRSKLSLQIEELSLCKPKDYVQIIKLSFFFSFYHNKIDPVCNYKAIKNKIIKTRHHTTFFNKQNNKNNLNKARTHTHKKKRKWDEITRYRPLPFYFKQSINQSYDL